MRKILAVATGLVAIALLAVPSGASHPDSVTCKAGQLHLSGTAQADNMGWYSSDVCLAGMGNPAGTHDRLRGSTSADNLWGMDNTDILYGGNGADLLKGGPGNDEIFDGRNPPDKGDTISGGDGYDILFWCSTNYQEDNVISIEEQYLNADWCDSGGA